MHIVKLTLKRIGMKLARLGEDAVFSIDGGGKMSTGRYVRARDGIIAVICYNANVTPLSHSTHLKDVTAKEGGHHLHKVRCVKIEAAIWTVDLDRCAKIAAVNDADLATFDLLGKCNNPIQKLANGAAANADTVLLRIAHKGNRLFPTDGNGLIDEHRDARGQIGLCIFVVVVTMARRDHNAVHLAHELVIASHYGNAKLLV